MSMTRKQGLVHTILILGGFFIPLLGYEVYLRGIGYTPLSPRTRSSIFRFPSAYQNDEILGWKLTPGEYRFEPVSVDAHETSGRILEGGQRTTHPKDFIPSSPSQSTIAFVGDSFTFGDGLNDDETYPWMVQQILKDYDVRNFAVPGYGTCQIYLQLVRQLDSGSLDGATMIYGMSQFHETRNLPDKRTAWGFSAVSPRKTYSAPSCLLDSEDQIKTVHARPYYDPVPLLSEHFSVGRRFVHFFYDIVDLSTASRRRPLSFALLKGIHELSKHHGQRFVVLLQRFSPEARTEYMDFLKRSKIEFLDGSHPNESSPEMQLVGDTHPNAFMNKYWAELISKSFANQEFERGDGQDR